MHDENPTWQYSFYFLLLFTLPLSQLAVDVYTPSTPDMVRTLHTSITTVQWSMTFYLFAMGLGMSIWGILSDYTGRRIVYLYGFVIYCLGTLTCLTADSGSMLLVGRVIQGFGAGAIVCLTAMFSDTFSGDRLLQVSTYSSLIWSLVPIIAPFIGGLLQQYVNWQANFIMMLAYGILGYLVLLCYLPETHPKSKRTPFPAREIVQIIGRALSKRAFIGNASLLVLSWSVMMIFSIMTPFLFETVYHISPTGYGLLALVFGAFYTCGIFLNGRLVIRFRPSEMIWIGNFGIISGGILLAITAALHWFNLWATLIPCLYTVTLSSFVYPNAWAKAVETFDKRAAGIASALMMSYVLGGTAMLTLLASSFRIYSQWPLAICFTALGISSSLMLWLVPRKKHAC